MKTMKLVCPSCGTRYEKGKFCLECGSPLTEVAIKKVLYCPNCQEEVSSGKFCPECGTKLMEREVEIDTKSAPAAETSTPTIENVVDPEVEAILAKYRDEYGDMRELNIEEYTIAAEELEICASKGNLDAMCFLATLYIGGKGIPEDHSHAYKLLCEAERRGSKYAIALLGFFYMHGVIVAADDLEALHRFEEGYKYTHIPEIAGLISYYYIGHEDYAKALQYAQEAADKGNKDGLFVLGDIYLNGLGIEKNEQLAFEYYMQAAAQGDKTALNQIGWMYQNGCGIEEDPEQAFFWYNEAAQKDSDVGMNNLAYCYLNGYGVTQDEEVAAEWFKKAAEAGFVNSMLELGDYYQSTLFDTEKTKYWLLKAAECGNADAMNRLGNIYAESIEPDFKEAVSWYQKAIELNHPNAYRNLSLCYQYGCGVEKDLKKANNLLSQAEKLGFRDNGSYRDNLVLNQLDEDALVDEANELLNTGKQKDAVAIYKELAEKGNSRAQGNYGNCLLNAFGTKRNQKDGIAWLEKSAKQGDAWSCLKLVEAYLGFDLNGKSLKVDMKKANIFYKKAESCGEYADHIKYLEKFFTPSVETSDIKIEKDVLVGNEKGIRITFKMTVLGMVDRKFSFSAYSINDVWKKDFENPHSSHFDLLYTMNESLPYASTSWDSFEISIPYSSILSKQANFDETLVLIAWDNTDKKPKMLYRENIPFHISCITHTFRSDEWNFYLRKK